MKKRERIKNTIIFLGLCLITIIVLFPVVTAFFASFKPKSEIVTQVPHILPKEFTLDNYIRLFTRRKAMMYFRNSMIVAVALMLINVILALPGAFAFSWMRFRGRVAMMRSLLITYMFPTVLFAMPYYMMCSRLGLLNKSGGLIITYLAFSLPFSIWMLKNSFDALPGELIEAGLIDGCSNSMCLRKIVIPISLPAISVVAVYSFIIGFSEYMFASTLMTEETARTLPLMLSMMTGRYHTDYGILMAASMLLVLPITVLYLLVQRYFVDGILTGAVKE